MSFKYRGDEESHDLKIAVLGLGHVGLPTALGLCSLGWHVIGADEDAAKVELIRSGKSPFFEPGVDQLLHQHLANAKLRLTSKVTEAVCAQPP